MGQEVKLVPEDIFTNKVPPRQILFMGYSMRLSASESKVSNSVTDELESGSGNV
jgi:hypothetical protein